MSKFAKLWSNSPHLLPLQTDTIPPSTFGGRIFSERKFCSAYGRVPWGLLIAEAEMNSFTLFKYLKTEKSPDTGK